MRSEIIKPVKKVRGGISVSHEKHTKDMQVKRIPAPETVTLPMSQHIGAPCTPTVKVGDRVLVGQVVGDTDKYVSAPVHASVSGKVTAVKEIRTAQGIVSQAVIIENDGLMEEAEFTPPKVETHDDLIKAVRASGAVGLGGAGFPTHVKLNFPQDGSVDTLIINAAECEPYITVDYRECLDNSWDVMSGVHLLKDMLNFKKVIIAVEDNKPDAIKILERIAEKDDPDDVIKVIREPPVKIITGGPMMGTSIVDTHHPILKCNNAILAFTDDDMSLKTETACIHCGRCAKACPMYLQPTVIHKYAVQKDVKNLLKAGAMVCMECGSCAYTCPAGKPLVQFMRDAKSIVRSEAQKK